MTPDTSPAIPRSPADWAADALLIVIAAGYCLRRLHTALSFFDADPLSAEAIVIGPFVLLALPAWFWWRPRRRTPRPILSIGAWVLLISSILIVATFAVSLWWRVEWRGALWDISLHQGAIQFHPSGGTPPLGLTITRPHPQTSWIWTPACTREPTNIVLQLPLWPVLLATALPGMWLIRHRRGR